MVDPEKLREEYIRLLGQEGREQVYQAFLEQNTRLIPREFVQNHGIGCSIVLRKLAFGPDYKSDFFYFSKSSDDWNAVFIELEKPQSRFFKKNTNEFHGDFISALEQINQWRAWFDRGNQNAFLSTVSAIQVPHHMAASNPTFNKFVLVFGRRSEYSGNEIRRSLIRGQERDDFKIITFDSLVEDLEHKHEVAIGVRHNEYIDIITDEIISASLYSWVEPTRLRVSKCLYDKLANGPTSNHYVMSDNGPVDALKHAALRVRIRPIE
ncbi:Shedu immune nuclease family protein [Solirhodobacter olei]|uniref:Shedu immune nuclease family protein n=1 Tax=Solirhodobacter olei TaxID=2493082 RepID=UPI0019D4EBC6|nr:Shedu immune nuclease family protein [Solirhodobacter olei]